MNTTSHILVKSDSGSRLQIIDVLRFCAAISVVFYHWCFRGALDHNMAIRYSELTGLTSYMHLSVRLFYMISGFVICYSAKGKTAMQFAWSRFVRLYPTFWLCLTISWVLLTLYWPTSFHVPFSGYLVNLTMLQQYFKVEHVDQVYWTLVQELHFYGLMFLVLLFGLQKRLLTLVAIWIGLSGIDYFIKVPLARFEMVLDEAPFFAAGVVCYLIYRDGAKIAHWLLLLACYVIGLTRFIHYSVVDEQNVGVVLSQPFLALFIACLFAIMVAVALHKVSDFQCSWSPVLGGMSYPLYLLHDRIGFMLVSRLGGSLNRWALLAILMVGLCSVSYAVWRWYEVPMMALLHRRFGHFFQPKNLAQSGIT